MSWISMATLTAQLPDEGGLRTAAYALRGAGDALNGQASVTRSVVDTIGPGVWNDDASGTARAILSGLGGELSTGSSAMFRSADALDALASYVASQRPRYEETERLLAGLARDPFGEIVEHHELAEAERLIDERRSIEWNVSAAMGQASEVISQAAGEATRYHGGNGSSIWSRIEQYAKDGGHDTADLVSGVWDGTYGVVKDTVKTFLALTELSAKLSTVRLLADPAGWEHDAEHALNTFVTDVSAIAHRPKEFVENVLNLQELAKDPVHWVGELIPNLALFLLTDGAGAGVKGADTADAVDTATEGISAASKSADAASALPRLLPQEVFDHSLDGNLNVANGKWGGFHSAPGGVMPAGRRIISYGTDGPDRPWVAKVQYFDPSKGWVPPNGKDSTMFPMSWTKDYTEHAIQEAYSNRTITSIRPDGSVRWQGEYDGVTIGGWVNTKNGPPTAYPIIEPFERL
jgi:hypothetical protein